MMRAFEQEPVALCAAACLVLFTGLYSCWTLLHTSATFLHISWATTKILAVPALAGGAALAWPVGRAFVRCYLDNAPRQAGPPPSLAAALAVVALAAVLYCLPGYASRYCLAVAVFFLAAVFRFRAASGAGEAVAPASPAAEAAPRFALPLFGALVGLAALFTLCAHRSDYDDSVYLQIATQTMLYPERAPLTYDISLGMMIETFRSQVYRFSAYENFSALLAEATGLRLMDVYYLLLPAVGSALCMCAAYLLARWFLDARAALLALAVFLLVIIAWGDTHYAYGNLALVRLYQGKCWLVTVSTPFVVTSGLVLLRENSLANWLCWAAGNIMAVGLSVNGMVIACGVTLLLALPALAGPPRRGLRNLALLGAGSLYPVLCGLLLNLKLKYPALGHLLLEKFRFIIYSH